MSKDTEFKIGGLFVAALFGVGVPAFLLGPSWFGDASFSAISFTAKACSFTSMALGLWFLLVTLLALPKDLEKVLLPFQGAEVGLLCLPYMLFVGTKSVWRRVMGSRRDRRR